MMKKSLFTLVALLLLALLIGLFLNSGIISSEDQTPTMIWSRGRFEIAETSKILGGLIVLWIPAFMLLRKRIKN